MQLNNSISYSPICLKLKVLATDCDGTKKCSNSYGRSYEAWPQFIKAKIALLESVTFHLYLFTLSLFSATSLPFCGDVFKIIV